MPQSKYLGKDELPEFLNVLKKQWDADIPERVERLFPTKENWTRKALLKTALVQRRLVDQEAARSFNKMKCH